MTGKGIKPSINQASDAALYKKIKWDYVLRITSLWRVNEI